MIEPLKRCVFWKKQSTACRQQLLSLLWPKMSHLFTTNAAGPQKTDLVLTRRGQRRTTKPVSAQPMNGESTFVCLFYTTHTHTHGRAHLSIEAVSHGRVGCYLWVIVQSCVASRRKNEVSHNKGGERERKREWRLFHLSPPLLRRAPSTMGWYLVISPPEPDVLLWGRNCCTRMNVRRQRSLALLQELITTSFPKTLFLWIF